MLSRWLPGLPQKSCSATCAAESHLLNTSLSCRSDRNLAIDSPETFSTAIVAINAERRSVELTACKSHTASIAVYAPYRSSDGVCFFADPTTPVGASHCDAAPPAAGEAFRICCCTAAAKEGASSTLCPVREDDCDDANMTFWDTSSKRCIPKASGCPKKRIECPSGTYRREIDTVRNTSTSDAELEECSACPKQGATCAQNDVQIMSNWWLAPPEEGTYVILDEETKLYRCFNAEACVTPLLNTLKVECDISKGYKGVLCGACELKQMNYIRIGDRCALCRSRIQSIGITALFVVVLVLMMLYYVAVHRYDMGSKLDGQVGAAVKIFMSYCQMLSIFGVFQAKGTEFFRIVMQWPIAVAGGEITTTLFVKCAIRSQLYALFRWTMLAPLIAAALTGIFLIPKYLVERYLEGKRSGQKLVLVNLHPDTGVTVVGPEMWAIPETPYSKFDATTPVHEALSSSESASSWKLKPQVLREYPTTRKLRCVRTRSLPRGWTKFANEDGQPYWQKGDDELTKSEIHPGELPNERSCCCLEMLSPQRDYRAARRKVHEGDARSHVLEWRFYPRIEWRRDPMAPGISAKDAPRKHKLLGFWICGTIDRRKYEEANAGLLVDLLLKCSTSCCSSCCSDCVEDLREEGREEGDVGDKRKEAWAAARKKELAARFRLGHRLAAVSTFVLFSLYPTLITTAISVLRCQEIDGRFYLFGDWNKECWVTSEHILHAVLGAIGLLVYAIGIPLGTFFVVFTHRRQIADWDIPTHEAWGFLFGGFSITRGHIRGLQIQEGDRYVTPDEKKLRKGSCCQADGKSRREARIRRRDAMGGIVMSWEAIVMLRKLCITCLSVFRFSAIAELMLAICLLVTCLVLQVNVRPYNVHWLNVLEEITFVVLLLTQVLSMIYLDLETRTQEGSRLQDAELWTSVALICLNALAFLGLLIVVLITVFRAHGAKCGFYFSHKFLESIFAETWDKIDVIPLKRVRLAWCDADGHESVHQAGPPCITVKWKQSASDGHAQIIEPIVHRGCIVPPPLGHELVFIDIRTQHVLELDADGMLTSRSRGRLEPHWVDATIRDDHVAMRMNIIPSMRPHEEWRNSRTGEVSYVDPYHSFSAIEDEEKKRKRDAEDDKRKTEAEEAAEGNQGEFLISPNPRSANRGSGAGSRLHRLASFLTPRGGSRASPGKSLVCTPRSSFADSVAPVADAGEIEMVEGRSAPVETSLSSATSDSRARPQPQDAGGTGAAHVAVETTNPRALTVRASSSLHM